MRKVVVASHNPLKLEVAQRAFAAVFPGEGFEFIPISTDELDLPKQPRGDFETRLCAVNRLSFVQASEKVPVADFYISQEGGIVQGVNDREIRNRAWIFVSSKDGTIFDEATATFSLPDAVAKHVLTGLELRDAAVRVWPELAAHGNRATILGKLTNGLLDRVDYYLQPAIIALSRLRAETEVG